jgi:hypothetical protein
LEWLDASKRVYKHTCSITLIDSEEVKELKCEKAVLVLILMMGVTLPVVFSENNNFSIDYTFTVVRMDNQYMIEDTVFREIPGTPIIPYRTARILLPYKTSLEDIQVKYGTPKLQEGFEIPWGQPACTSDNIPTVVDRNKNMCAEWYPGKLFEVVSTQVFRGYNIVYVDLFPVQYQLESQTVKFYEKLTINVQVARSTEHVLYRGTATDRTAVSSMVDNPEVLETYSEKAQPEQSEEYIIITNSTLHSAFQDLADHKSDYVNGTNIYDVEWIYSSYPGVDNAEKIRTFITSMYQTCGTEYCLLGGDVSVVPYRGFYASAGGYVDADIAADMYFGCLDGTFNADGDANWAEPEDGVDWLEEVFIGRAPVETVAEAELFVDKIIAYELAPRKKVCQFHTTGENSSIGDPREIPWKCEQWVPSDYTIKELFEQEHQITKQIWREAWDGSYDGEPYYPPVTFQHAGHGNTSCYGISSGITWYNQDVSSLSNSTFFPVHMSVASYVGEFTADDCLAEAYVKDDCGAIACYFNDSMAWFSSIDLTKYSGEFLETEFRALFSDGKEHLGELLNQAKSYWAPSAETDPYYRWCYYEINLIGDPESPCLTQREAPPEDTVTITNPANGAEVYGWVDITVAATGCIDAAEFYVDGTFLYTDTASPYAYRWDTHACAEDKQHTILVKGYCSGVFKAEHKIIVTVNNFYLEITNPSPGEIVSGIVTITTNVRGYDTVKFYIDSELKCTDETAPFQHEWDTTGYPNGDHTITAEGYVSGVFMEHTDIVCTVYNEGGCVGTVLVFLLLLAGSAGMGRH